jgi:hypothetical protein
MGIDRHQQTRLGRIRALASAMLAASGATFLATLLIPEPGIWSMLL